MNLSIHLCLQVTTHNLERVRRIKSRMVRLKTRGETIREVLEKYLDDDSDMKDMNLTAKCAFAFLCRHSFNVSSDFNLEGGGKVPGRL